VVDFRPYIGGALSSSNARVDSEAKVCGSCSYDKLTQTTTQTSDSILEWGGDDSAASGMLFSWSTKL